MYQSIFSNLAINGLHSSSIDILKAFEFSSKDLTQHPTPEEIVENLKISDFLNLIDFYKSVFFDDDDVVGMVFKKFACKAGFFYRFEEEEINEVVNIILMSASQCIGVPTTEIGLTNFYNFNVDKDEIFKSITLEDINKAAEFIACCTASKIKFLKFGRFECYFKRFYGVAFDNEETPKELYKLFYLLNYLKDRMKFLTAQD